MYWKLFIVWLSFKWMFRVNLGDFIWYKGKKYLVLNGVMSESWSIDIDNDFGGWVPRSECQKSWTPRNMIRSFRAGYRFYMGYWYDIWKREGIKDWMKTCKIW